MVFGGYIGREVVEKKIQLKLSFKYIIDLEHHRQELHRFNLAFQLPPACNPLHMLQKLHIQVMYPTVPRYLRVGDLKLAYFEET